MTALQEEELLKAFLDEAREALSEVNYLLVLLEREQENEELVGAVFRHVHSIKGNAPFFGFLKAKTLAHEMENVLQKVRDRALRPSSRIIGPLLKGVDELSNILARGGRKQPEVINQEAFDRLVKEVREAAIPEGGEAETDVALIQRLSELKRKISRDAPHLVAEVDSIVALVSKDKGGSEGQGCDLCSMVEAVLESDIDGRAKGTHIRQILLQLSGEDSSEELQATVGDLIETLDLFMAGIGFDTVLVDVIRSSLEKIRAYPRKTAPSPADSHVASNLPPPADSVPHRGESVKTMRIREDQVDTFLSYVGELVIVGEMLEHVSERLQSDAVGEAIVELRSLRSVFATLSQSLQSGIMAIRKVSVKTIAQKMPRLVRDVAELQGKEVRIQLFGEELEVDKSLIELIDAPLTHMVRNAVDHGIEAPDLRASRGKERRGNLEIRFEEHEHHISLVVSDDGGGLDLERITEKARAMGIVPAGVPLTEAQIIEFIFAAGVSTAAQVTEISGRGVGMDVVKQMIEASGGSITVSTVAGEGTTFEIRFNKSVTTQIMEGFFVEIDGEPFVVPLDKVRETFVVPGESINSMVGRGEFIVRHDEVLPVVSMHSVFGVEKQQQDERLMLSVIVKGRPAAFEIDEVLGVHQFVLKEIIGLSDLNPMLTGGALMGDGRIALVVDLPAIVEQGTEFN